MNQHGHVYSYVYVVCIRQYDDDDSHKNKHKGSNKKNTKCSTKKNNSHLKPRFDCALFFLLLVLVLYGVLSCGEQFFTQDITLVLASNSSVYEDLSDYKGDLRWYIITRGKDGLTLASYKSQSATQAKNILTKIQSPLVSPILACVIPSGFFTTRGSRDINNRDIISSLLRSCPVALGAVYPHNLKQGSISQLFEHTHISLTPQKAFASQILLRLYERGINIDRINPLKLQDTIQKKTKHKQIDFFNIFTAVQNEDLSYWKVKALEFYEFDFVGTKNDWIPLHLGLPAVKSNATLRDDFAMYDEPATRGRQAVQLPIGLWYYYCSNCDGDSDNNNDALLAFHQATPNQAASGQAASGQAASGQTTSRQTPACAGCPNIHLASIRLQKNPDTRELLVLYEGFF